VARAWVELHDGSRIELGGGPLRIGRARANDLVLDHESVSRHHAELRRDRGGVVIADLGSTNGTRVDGQAVREQVLTPGATIHIGAVPLRFRVAG
jgi:pSer/pThr/pTyr-binding forkhead associated (FHA) protein